MKTRENGRNVTLFWGFASVARSFGRAMNWLNQLSTTADEQL